MPYRDEVAAHCVGDDYTIGAGGLARSSTGHCGERDEGEDCSKVEGHCHKREGLLVERSADVQRGLSRRELDDLRALLAP